MVLNEWILHDLRGDNGPERQLAAGTYMQALKQKRDQIVVLRGSRWTQKAFELMAVSSPQVRILSQRLHLAILRDSDRCRYIETTQIEPLPTDLADEVPMDDVYLFQTAQAAGETLLVTSDGRLIDRVKSAVNRGIHLRARDEFLQEYLS
jgi:hypothetical protein